MASTRFDLETFHGENDYYLWSLKMQVILIQQWVDSALNAEDTDPKAKKKREKALQVQVETRKPSITKLTILSSYIFLMKC